MKKKELLLEVFTSPLIQSLLKQGAITKEQLVEFVLYEVEPDDSDPAEEVEVEEVPEEEPSPNTDTHDIKMINLAAKMAIQSGVKILKILAKIDTAVKFGRTDDGRREIPPEILAVDNIDEKKKYNELMMKLDNIELQITPHIKLQGTEVVVGSNPNNIYDFAQKVTIDGMKKLSEEQPQQFKILNSVYSQIFQSDKSDGSSVKPEVWSAVDAIEVNGYKFSKDNVVATANFISNTNPLLGAVKEQLKGFAGQAKKLQQGQMFVGLLNDIFQIRIGDGTKSSDIDIYKLFGDVE